MSRKQRSKKPDRRLRESHEQAFHVWRVSWKPMGAVVLLIVVTVVAYWPALGNGFIWDDESYVISNRTLRDLHGLWRIWFELTATPQYYPLVHTSFWLEYHLWGLNPLGYHLVNVLLHACGVVLLWRVLERLRVPGAWLAAAIFAVHPVGVESVAWVTERKNVLCAVLYFGSALAYLRYSPLDKEPQTFGRQRIWFYIASLGLFVLALLSKTVACTLPASLLVVAWWKRGRLRRQDVLPLLPFFAVGLSLGLLTAWLERHHVRAEGEEWAFTFPQRILIAGRALWFYAGKLFWPAKLTFIYPRWEINPRVIWQWFFPTGFVALIAVLWSLRKRVGRGPLAAVLSFAITLGPALGFVNVFPFRFSFVADHFQYLASVGLIVLAVNGLNYLPRATRILTVVLLPILATLTWNQAKTYRDLETLWRDTLMKNSAAWIAHSNLAAVLLDKGKPSEADAHSRQAIQLKPDYAEANLNLGIALYREGKPAEAIRRFEYALQLKPDYAEAEHNLGLALADEGRLSEAIQHYDRALRLKSDYADAYNNLGVALYRQQKSSEAINNYKQALRLKPDYAEADYNLGVALVAQKRFSEAIPYYERALELRPNNAEAHYNLGVALAAQGKGAEAIRHYERALECKPNDAAALNNLAYLLATTQDTRLRNSTRAIALAEEANRLTDAKSATVLATLATAYAESGHYLEAVETTNRALEQAGVEGNSDLQGILESQLKSYQTMLLPGGR